jgi:hypothetical protein
VLESVVAPLSENSESVECDDVDGNPVSVFHVAEPD